MGWWRDPQQALYVAIKFPLIILLTTLGNALINAMLAPLLGLNIPFRQSFSAILMSFTITAAILGAFSPLMAFMVWNAPPMSPAGLSSPTYSFIMLANVAVIAFAGTTGNVRLFQLLAQLGGKPGRRAARAVRVAGGQSVSRQPAFVDSAPVHRLARRCRWNFSARRRFTEIFTKTFFTHCCRFFNPTKPSTTMTYE